jgi:hypothetical protein
MASRLAQMRLADRADPATEIVAKKIIELAQQGERDRNRLLDCAKTPYGSFGISRLDRNPRRND